MKSVYTRLPVGRDVVVFPAGVTPVARFFCFPHAGGGPSAFHAWRADLPQDVELSVLLLPGREGRYSESPYTRFEDALGAASQALDALDDLPTVLFGHSLGALLAFEVSRSRSRHSSKPPILGLIAACMRAPSVPYSGPLTSTLSQAQLLQKISRLRGTPEEVLGNSAMMDAVLATIRADYAIHDSYVYRDKGSINVPLTIFTATDDDVLEPHLMSPWKELTIASTRQISIFGDHFAIHSRRKLVIIEALSLLSNHIDAPAWRPSPGMFSFSGA